MEYNDKDSQGSLNLAGEGNSRLSTSLHSYTLPRVDVDDSFQGDLRSDSLVKNEVFKGISGQEDSQWIRDSSQRDGGIKFSSSGTEPCSISRCNSVGTVARSLESVAMLSKSVGLEERIHEERIIKEVDAGSRMGRLTTDMEPNWEQDDKMEEVTNSQPSALLKYNLDGSNVNAIEAQNDSSPLNDCSANPTSKKRKTLPVSTSPGKTPDLATSVSDGTNHSSEEVTDPQAVVQNSFCAEDLLEMGPDVVNSVFSAAIAAAAACFASTNNSINYRGALSPTRENQIVEKNSEEISNKVEVAKLQAQDATAHAAAAIGNCSDVWSQLSKRSDGETKLTSASMAISAAASVAKAAAATAKLALNIAVEAKLGADEVSCVSVTENNTQSAGNAFLSASNILPMVGDENISACSIIASAKASVEKRLKAATAASKHAEKLDAIVAAAELAAEAVSQAGRMVSIGDLYWKTDTKEKQIAIDEPRKLAAAGGNLGETVEQNKSSSQLSEPRRSNRTIQPSSRLLEAMEASSIISKSPFTPRGKTPRSQNRGKRSHG